MNKAEYSSDDGWMRQCLIELLRCTIHPEEKSSWADPGYKNVRIGIAKKKGCDQSRSMLWGSKDELRPPELLECLFDIAVGVSKQ
jgi:hypothetical protein